MHSTTRSSDLQSGRHSAVMTASVSMRLSPCLDLKSSRTVAHNKFTNLCCSYCKCLSADNCKHRAPCKSLVHRHMRLLTMCGRVGNTFPLLLHVLVISPEMTYKTSKMSVHASIHPCIVIIPFSKR